MCEYILFCPECRGHLTKTREHIVCSSCGLVLEKTYSIPADLTVNHFFGKRLNLVDGLGSYMGYPKSSKGEGALSTGRRASINRLKRINFYSRIVNATEYRILKVLNEVARLLNLPDYIRDSAALFYKRIREVKGRNVKSHITLLAACIILAARNQGKNPFTIEDICITFRKMGHKSFVKSVKRALLEYCPIIKVSVRTNRSEEYLPKMFSQLANNVALNEKIRAYFIEEGHYWHRLESNAVALLEKIPGVARGGRNPRIFAAAVIYACEQELSKEQGIKPVLSQCLLAKTFQVAEFSIRDHYSAVIKKYLKESIGDKKYSDKVCEVAQN